MSCLLARVSVDYHVRTSVCPRVWAGLAAGHRARQRGCSAFGWPCTCGAVGYAQGWVFGGLSIMAVVELRPTASHQQQAAAHRKDPAHSKRHAAGTSAQQVAAGGGVRNGASGSTQQRAAAYAAKAITCRTRIRKQRQRQRQSLPATSGSRGARHVRTEGGVGGWERFGPRGAP